jgi:hypothetical protein
MVKLILVLAQAPWAEQGDVNDHLDLTVQLTAQGRFDTAAFQAAPDHWTALRRRPDHHPRAYHLVRTDKAWALHSMDNDDEPLIDLSTDILRPGEVVGLQQPDGGKIWFRIVSVEPG